ncbi:uncharacterized protein TNCV_929901 [Trichonephila clavipes]|nr:uncharacterized protein TNCV_929901 [Trichonephila clavipes]
MECRFFDIKTYPPMGKSLRDGNLKRNPGGTNSDAQRVNPEFTVGSNFRIFPEQYFSGMENVAEFLENIDNNLTCVIRDIYTTGACAYLKVHLTGRAIDWFEFLGYRVVKSVFFQKEFNRFESQSVADNRRFDSRRRGGQSDHRFHNQGVRQSDSRNGALRGQNGQNLYLNF